MHEEKEFSSPSKRLEDFVSRTHEVQAARLEVQQSDAVREVWRRYINEVASLFAALSSDVDS